MADFQVKLPLIKSENVWVDHVFEVAIITCPDVFYHQ